MPVTLTRDVSGKSYPGSPDLRTLVSDTGESWLVYRKSLRPHYGKVWGDIALYYLMIAGGVAGACALNHWQGLVVALAAAPFVGLWIGYWLHALSAFGHEAAHGNLAARRSINDLLANGLVYVWIGLEVKTYRNIHWQHHLHLGEPEDTEVSYHNPLSLGFLLELFTGLYLIRMVSLYQRSVAPKGPQAARGKSNRARFLLGFARTAVLHITVLGVFAAAQWYGAVLAWLSGMVAFSAFGIVRQILEHRADDADPDADYRRLEHGPVNRLFEGGFLSRHFGSAGFNRHLLHHWDPAISYTRFDEMAAFLRRTALARHLEAARSTYWSTLLKLLAARKT